jgi:hypothetical protein
VQPPAHVAWVGLQWAANLDAIAGMKYSVRGDAFAENTEGHGVPPDLGETLDEPGQLDGATRREPRVESDDHD